VIAAENHALRRRLTVRRRLGRSGRRPAIVSASGRFRTLVAKSSGATVATPPGLATRFLIGDRIAPAAAVPTARLPSGRFTAQRTGDAGPHASRLRDESPYRRRAITRKGVSRLQHMRPASAGVRSKTRIQEQDPHLHRIENCSPHWTISGTGPLCGSLREFCTHCDPHSGPRRAERAQETLRQPAEGLRAEISRGGAPWLVGVGTTGWSP
jgi:hypothetical protein